MRSSPRAMGQLAKTDRLNAHNLAHFAEAIRPDPSDPDEQTQALAARVARRRPLIEMPTTDKNRAPRGRACPATGAGPYRPAGRGTGAQHDRSAHHHTAESGVAGKGRRIAECAGCRSPAHHDAPCESSRAWHVDSQRNGGFSGRRAVLARQRYPQRPTGELMCRPSIWQRWWPRNYLLVIL